MRDREHAGKEHTQRITAIVTNWIHHHGAYCHDNCFCSMAKSRLTVSALITKEKQAFLPNAACILVIRKP